ncbi:hypothetical protein PHYC_00195 [Phycisphaerales bacterium]|nr:hypothetical protein PHYC_00195 [Phycisphaerales bacterium]
MVGSGRDYTLVELDGRRLTAIAAAVGLERVEVLRWHTADRPERIKGDDAAALGGWIAEELRQAEIARGRVVLVIPRGEVVLKPLSLPRPAVGAVGDAELGGMVRLQIARQLTMTTEQTAIDYVVLGEAAGEGAGTVNVLAGALPADRAAWWMSLSDEAGLAVKRIALRCLGIGALLGELSVRRAGAVMGVAVGAHATDFVIVEEGRVVFARAAEQPRPADSDAFETFAERIGVEAKRTWMSHRGGKTAGAIEGVVVVGEGSLCERVAARCGAALDTKGETMRAPALVRMPDHMPEMLRADAAALMGLLLEVVQERVSLDFANPRKAPDAAARKRQLTLAGVLGAIILGGGGYVAASQSLQGLRGDLKGLEAREKTLQGDVDAFLREHARVRHVEQWRGGGVDWLSHVAYLNQAMPDPRLATLDEFTARMSGEVSFSLKPKSSYPAGTWAVRRSASIDLTGRMEARQVASELRDILIASGAYEVQSRGADTPERFSLLLASDRLKPIPEPAAAKPSGKGAAK